MERLKELDWPGFYEMETLFWMRQSIKSFFFFFFSPSLLSPLSLPLALSLSPSNQYRHNFRLKRFVCSSARLLVRSFIRSFNKQSAIKKVFLNLPLFSAEQKHQNYSIEREKNEWDDCCCSFVSIFVMTMRMPLILIYYLCCYC